jgi:hypothetical protein
MKLSAKFRPRGVVLQEKTLQIPFKYVQIDDSIASMLRYVD